MRSRRGFGLTVPCVSLMVFVTGSALASVTINYEITGSSPNHDWSGTIVVDSLDSPINSITGSTQNVTITEYDTETLAIDEMWVSSPDYVQFNHVYFSGMEYNAFKLSSTEFYQLVTGGGTWGDVIGQTYTTALGNFFDTRHDGGVEVIAMGGTFSFSLAGGGPQEATVPTLSEWGIIALGLGLAALGALKMRRIRLAATPA